MANATTLLTRRSMRSHLGRNIFIGLTILVGVSFVMGSFVLADSMRRTFNDLFTTANQGVDFVVRAELNTDNPRAVRDSIPLSLGDSIAAVEGVAEADPGIQRMITLLDADGEAVTSTGGPIFALSWDGNTTDDAGITIKQGRPANADDEAVIDQASFEAHGYKLDGPLQIVVDGREVDFTLVGTFGMADTKGFAGAKIVGMTFDRAQQVFDTGDQVDTIEIVLADNADPDAVEAAVTALLPERIEIITGQERADEASEQMNTIVGYVGTGLLIFAFITAFVSAFIINNVFGITIGQRLREMALLRSIGARARQLTRMIIVEALTVSVIATVLGFAAGIGVAKLLIWFFSIAGGGFPDVALRISVPGMVIGAIVGIGITLASVIVPAKRAARIPPIAALQPEIGFEAVNSARRTTLGAAVTVGGLAAITIGLLLRPGGAWGMAILSAIGALATFMGIASLSATVARPVVSVIGAPIARFFRVPGRLAVNNARRSPRRTARTASALMIGVALMGAAGVFASGLRTNFIRVLERSVNADYVVNASDQFGFSPEVAKRLAEVEGIAAVSPVRVVLASINGGDIEGIGAVDPTTVDALIDLDMTSGGWDGVTATDGVLLHRPVAERLEASLGDTLDITWQNGKAGTVTVAGIFADAGLGGEIYVSIDLLDAVLGQPPRDLSVLARLDEGIDDATIRPELDAILADFPNLQLVNSAEFQETISQQINQLLAMITGLLALSMAIAVIGIAITMALSVFERTSEIGLLRAVGMTRRQLRRAIRWESVIVSIFGGLIGIVIGLYLGAILSIAVPDEVISTITVPWSMITTVIIGSLIAGLAASVWPAYRAGRMDVLEAIATE
ncbi:MAG: hypothetical protein CSA55_00565 [Ilumatobacter coccineus]|uniref:ABC transporter permease protein n=1 Tax=Ilumatobacter coccineus TaxID=467094 RepID=A0A2G6KFW0_9ACTN|nr:MAG: hypothetical protein CSA55_00565 [Ilumatobacter coccineus]